MGTFNQSLTRIRRFLRDPDGAIWSSTDIRRYFNESQYWFAQKAPLLERVDAYKWPPVFDVSYMHDWERAYGEGTKYRCFTQWQANGVVITYPWEANYWQTNNDTQDDGYRFTHPWESAYADPADYVPAPLHEQFHKALLVAWDNEPIEPLGQLELSKDDPYYRTRSGQPQGYWRPDNWSNLMVLYPRPASVVWQDYNPGDTFSYTLGEGLVQWQEDALDYSNTGITTDSIDSADALLMVFEVLPTEVPDDATAWDDELDWPEWMIHYIEAGCLERAFGADTDGHIPSLRDYWMMRAKAGVAAVNLFKRKREADREFRMGGPVRAGKSRLRLPSGYPAI